MTDGYIDQMLMSQQPLADAADEDVSSERDVCLCGCGAPTNQLCYRRCQLPHSPSHASEESNEVLNDLLASRPHQLLDSRNSHSHSQYDQFYSELI